MSMVIEVGAGKEFGPPFPGVDYVVTDPDLAVLESAREQLQEAACAAVAVSGNDLPVHSRSIEIIVARNVFGDPLLVMPNKQTQKEALFGLAREGKFEEYLEVEKGLQETAQGLKDGIVREAGRVLVDGGQLLVVENRTPWVAEAYLNGQGQLVAAAAGLAIAKTELGEVAPPNYADHYRTHPLPVEAWTLTKL